MATLDARIPHLVRLARWRDILIPADVTRCATITGSELKRSK